MIVNDRITDYIQSLETSQGPVLDEIEKEALDQFVPIIRKETAAFLRTMTAALKPSTILEIKTLIQEQAQAESWQKWEFHIFFYIQLHLDTAIPMDQPAGFYI